MTFRSDIDSISQLKEGTVSPCPECGSDTGEIFDDIVICYSCEHAGPRQTGPNPDWRKAIADWNDAAEDRHSKGDRPKSLYLD